MTKEYRGKIRGHQLVQSIENYFRDYQLTDRRGLVLLLCLIPLYVFFVWLFSNHFGFNRWDNFEYLGIASFEAHRLWLSGTIPFWDQYQNLGEPILAMGQTSGLYLPYTLIVALMEGLGVPKTDFANIVVLTHMPIMAWGWYRFFRLYNVYPGWAVMGALSATTCGGLMIFQLFWIFVTGACAWIPWVLVGLTRLIRDGERKKAPFIVAVGMVLIAWVGHPQFMTYSWLFCGIYGLFLLWGRPIKNWFYVGVVFLSCVLMSLLALLPIMELFPYSDRTQTLSMAEFTSRHLSFRSVWGFVTPLLRTRSEFMWENAVAVEIHGGYWVFLMFILSMVFGSIGFFTMPGELRRCFRCFFVLSILFFIFSLGNYGGLYMLTHWIPVWSSMRWPIKFIPYFGMASVVLATFFLQWLEDPLKKWKGRRLYQVWLPTIEPITKIITLVLFVFTVVLIAVRGKAEAMGVEFWLSATAILAGLTGIYTFSGGYSGIIIAKGSDPSRAGDSHLFP